MYQGKKVRLRRLAPDDADTIFRHWNDYELRQYLPTPLPSTPEDLAKYIDTANEAFSKRSKFTFGIETLEGILIGIIDLANISWISRNGEVSLFAIFDPKFRGGGYGKDAMLLLLDIAFSVLDLHGVYLWVASFNERAIGFYERIGFSTQGRLREMAFRDGKRHDVVVMDILMSEFRDRHGILPKIDTVIE